jgi:ubiquitin-conjugating enzyme E2 Z
MNSALKRIMNIDMKRILSSDLNSNGIFIEFDETDILKAKALIIGPKDTIYDNAYLFFTIEFPKNYPFSPPILTYKSQNKVRIHPNIYVNGKVCLSILGTWSGPSWTHTMDITTVLLTIQSLLDNNPLANEPGYEKISGNNNLIYENYNKIIRYNTIDSLIVDRINTEFIDFDIFKNTMIEYFKKNNLYINDTIEINKNIKENIKIGIYRIDISIDYEYLKIKYDKLNINLN